MEALGIDLKLLIAQIVNFAVLFLLLRKFLYKPLTTILSERSKKIEDGIKNAEKAGKQLEKAEQEADKIREKAYKDANEILKNGKSEANQEASEIIKKASEQAQRILETAQNEKITFKETAMTEAKAEISDVIVLALNKIVKEGMNEKQRNDAISNVVKEL